ncbi:alcohol dehydrogenase catalytic domain-containing protein [Kamptonema cortianum]|nr:alcohol dehydrogenase catalytic domain-containing protein [Geitlerinema splendidum]MDK3155346.1 alcohol dehydrogenase catalytic domain-containing protein [Kamptonema cortianum]
MKLARYLGDGKVGVFEEDKPSCPPGGLLVQTQACGLCSGELMAWYMDRKVPHVLGHEVSGQVVESDDFRYPVGSLVAPHHHAPCGSCELCMRGAYVHCPTWQATKLVPGGMAEFFAVPAENLADTHLVNDLSPSLAALIEPLACVVKCLRRTSYRPDEKAAVIGLGVMGLFHARLMPNCVAYDFNPERIERARSQGIDARHPDDAEPGATCVIVCPGTASALQFAFNLAGPDARIGLFAPLPPGPQEIDMESLYMRDAVLVNSYSCGPNDTAEAVSILRTQPFTAEEFVSDFVTLNDLPKAYAKMKAGEILKAMVIFE